MSHQNETKSVRKRRKANKFSRAQRIFSWLLIAFTVVLIISSLIELVVTFIGFEKNKKKLSKHEKKIRKLLIT